MAHKGQCNKKWFAANKKDRMQTKRIGCKQKDMMQTKKIGCKQKDRMQTKKIGKQKDRMQTERSDANKKPKPVTMQALARPADTVTLNVLQTSNYYPEAVMD